MALPITDIYINIHPSASGWAILTAKNTNKQGVPPLATLGDTSDYRFWFYSIEQDSASGTTVRMNDVTLQLAGREAPGLEANPYLLYSNTFTEAGDGTAGWNYTATLDFNNQDIVDAFNGKNSKKTVLCDIAATNVDDEEYTIQIPIEVRSQVLTGTPSITPAGPTYVTQAELDALHTEESLSNATGNTTITIPAGSKRHTVYLTYTGAASTRIIAISTTNATDAAALKIVSYFPPTAGIIQQVKNATTGGTVLDTTTSDASGRKASVEFGYVVSAWTSNGGTYPA